MSDVLIDGSDKATSQHSEQRSETTRSNDVKRLLLDDDLVPDRDAAGRMYGDVHADHLELNMDTTLDHLVEADQNLLSMDRQAASDELRKFMTYLNLDREETQQFVNAINGGFASDKDARSGWQKETRKVLNREYGTKAGDRLLAAEAAIARYGDLGKFLKKHGLGNHPDIVRLIAKKAPAINARYQK